MIREIKLPEPVYKSNISLEEVLLKRRSIRNYKNENLTIKQLAQILWAAQGITSDYGYRTAPSAGAIYPIEIYILVNNVKGLEKGIYYYNPFKHLLQFLKKGDFSEQIKRACLGQEWVKKASVDVIITAEFERTMNRYGERGIRYVYLEAGHIAQNIYLQMISLNLGGVVIGAFIDNSVQHVLSTPKTHKPIYVIPIGVPE